MDTMSVLKETMAKELDRSFEDMNLTTTFEDLALDSLDVVQVIMSIEEAFDIEIEDEAAEAFSTVADLVEYIDANHK